MSRYISSERLVRLGRAIAFGVVTVACASARAEHPCEPGETERMESQLRTPGGDVIVTCDFFLPPGEIFTSRLVVEGAVDGITIDCNGSTLDGSDTAGADEISIHSLAPTDPNADPAFAPWSAPSNITVRNCFIVGSARVFGMAPNADPVERGDHPESAAFRRSSWNSESGTGIEHTERARRNAPTNVRFDTVVITGIARTPLYIGPGVTHFILENSVITGKADKIAIYLDAESGFNILRHNAINTRVKPDGVDRFNGKWAKSGYGLVAIDGSDHNRIFDNDFSGLYNGGIYIYRNCGEGAVIRVNEPRGNQVINNTFFYREYSGSNPAIFVGSRNGWTPSKDYCSRDTNRTDFGVEYGSALDNFDHAIDTIVFQNQFLNRLESDSIKIGRSDINIGTISGLNGQVGEFEERLAGCYTPTDAPEPLASEDFLLSGESVSVAFDEDGRPRCAMHRYECFDNSLLFLPNDECSNPPVPFSCSMLHDNVGCTGTVVCPVGQSIIDVRAVCDLEVGTAIAQSDVDETLVGHVRVVVPSDHVNEGRCNIGATSISQGDAAVDLSGITESITFSCEEHDENGGDCAIRGEIFCE